MKPRHPRLRQAARVIFVVFLLAVAVLLVRAAQAIDWEQVRATIAGYSLRTLAMATAVLAMLPPVAVVIFMQRLFVRGLVETEK